MDNDLVLKKVHEELQRRFRVAGRGAVSRVQEQLQLGAGYFRDLRRPGRRRFDLRVLLDALGALQVNPAEFFSTVLGSMDPMTAFKAEAMALRRRQKRQPRILDLLDERELEQRGEIFDLDRLNAKFRHHPKQVRQRVVAWIRRIDKSQIPSLLAIYASACRISAQLESAQIILAHAYNLAEEAGDVPVQADILNRSAYVLAARSDFQGAIALTEKAILAFTRSAQSIGIGKALVDLASWHVYLEQYDQALEIYRAALQHLPADSGHLDVGANRCSIYINLGLISMRLHQFEQARDFVRSARQESDGVDASLLGKAIWLEAEIARREERYDLAEDLYEEAIDIYHERAPLDVAVLSVELVRVQLLKGKLAKAYATAKAMTTLLFPLEHNPIAAAAITELIRCALEGRGLTIKLIDHVAQELSQGNHTPRSHAST